MKEGVKEKMSGKGMECMPMCGGEDDEGNKWSCEMCGPCLDNEDDTVCDDALLTDCMNMCGGCLDCLVMSSPCGKGCAEANCDECLGCLDGNDNTACPERCEVDCSPCGECLEDHYGDKEDGHDKKDHTAAKK